MRPNQRPMSKKQRAHAEAYGLAPKKWPRWKSAVFVIVTSVIIWGLLAAALYAKWG